MTNSTRVCECGGRHAATRSGYGGHSRSRLHLAWQAARARKYEPGGYFTVWDADGRPERWRYGRVSIRERHLLLWSRGGPLGAESRVTISTGIWFDLATGVAIPGTGDRIDGHDLARLREKMGSSVTWTA